MRAIVDVNIDFVTQEVLLGSTYDCHQTDEWKDPQEGTQDCLMDRIHLCAKEDNGMNWDFTSCLFMNQLVTTNKTDHMFGFNKTFEYCSAVSHVSYDSVRQCAYSDKGARLLQASHKKEQEHNPNRNHINWIIVDGVNHANDVNADWLKIVCDAYTGSPKPASCSDGSASTKVVIL